MYAFVFNVYIVLKAEIKIVMLTYILIIVDPQQNSQSGFKIRHICTLRRCFCP